VTQIIRTKIEETVFGKRMSEMKNCGECSHGREIPIERRGNKTYLFFFLKLNRKKDLYAALKCPDWDGKGDVKG